MRGKEEKKIEAKNYKTREELEDRKSYITRRRKN